MYFSSNWLKLILVTYTLISSKDYFSSLSNIELLKFSLKKIRIVNFISNPPPTYDLPKLPYLTFFRITCPSFTPFNLFNFFSLIQRKSCCIYPLAYPIINLIYRNLTACTLNPSYFWQRSPQIELSNINYYVREKTGAYSSAISDNIVHNYCLI